MSFLVEGHPTTIQFATTSFVANTVRHVEVTPIGYSGGGKIDLSSMENTNVMIAGPKTLYDVTSARYKIWYDPVIWNPVSGVPKLRINQRIQFTFSDLSVVVIWGYVDEWIPDPIRSGERPTGDLVIIPTNRDNSNPPVETIPVYSATFIF